MNALPSFLKLSLLPLLAASLQAASSYKVQSGDTLSSIARKTGTTANKIMQANGISNPNKLRVGQVLKISSSRPSSTPKTSAPSQSSGNYTVKAGETLYSIARKHKLSVSQLTKMNPGLNPSKLSVGQQIVTNGTVSPKPKATQKPKPVPAIAAAEAAPTRSPLAMPAVVGSTLPPVETSPIPMPKIIADRKAEVPASISSVLVQKEISFGALASKHQTSTKQLNELNGWNLKPTTILAKESEVYVPGT